MVKYVLFGAGTNGLGAYQYLKGKIDIKFFADNNVKTFFGGMN